jgi:hypothetical protein
VWQVWVISRNYNTDERMVPLMERIATEIASKVNSIPTARARAHTHALEVAAWLGGVSCTTVWLFF